MPNKHALGWTVESLHAALNGKATPEQARLIAAAPELLGALVEAELSMRALRATEKQSLMHDAWQKARAAIARATQD